MRTYLGLLLCAMTLLLAACQLPTNLGEGTLPGTLPATPTAVQGAALETATFAGGCFWSMQRALEAVPGVITTTVGYTGGDWPNPTYAQVAAEITGHAESVEVIFDTTQISYEQLLTEYWHHVDPLTVDAQFCDVGNSYRTAIFTHSAEQQRLAEASKQALEASGRFNQPIVTEIEPATEFYPAEEYHQYFYRKRPGDYERYRIACGRDQRLAELWGDLK